MSHDGLVNSADLSPDGLKMVTSSDDRTARIWDARSGQLLMNLKHEAAVKSAQFSQDGKCLITASDDGRARTWNASSGEIVAIFKHEEEIKSAQFSLDGRWVVTASMDKTARIWEAQTGQLRAVLKHDAAVSTARFSINDMQVFTSTPEHAWVWNARTGQMLARREIGWMLAEFSFDGKRLVAGAGEKTAQVWDLGSWQPVGELLKHDQLISSAQFSPDGHWVVTASFDQTARVWDARTGLPRTEPLKHQGAVFSAQFSRDGRWVVTASEDKSIRVWDANSGQPVTDPLAHDVGVGLLYPTKFSADGRWMFSVSGRTVQVWELPFISSPFPEWLPSLAEAVAGQRITAEGYRESVSDDQSLRFLEQLKKGTSTDYYTRWAKWFLANPTVRTISPNSRLTLAEYVQRRIHENSLESLREATKLSPTNGLAFARFAKLLLPPDDAQRRGQEQRLASSLHRGTQVSPTNGQSYLDEQPAFSQLAKSLVDQEIKANTNSFNEADFYSQYALKWSPNDPEVQRIRAEIVDTIAKLPKSGEK